AVTMTLAAMRTEGGSRRKRDMRRSIRFGRGTRGSRRSPGALRRDGNAPPLGFSQIAPVGQGRREGGREGEEPGKEHDPEKESQDDPQAAVVLGVPLEPVAEEQRREQP